MDTIIMDGATGKVTVRAMTPEEEADHVAQQGVEAKKRAVAEEMAKIHAEAVAKVIASDPDLSARMAEAMK